MAELAKRVVDGGLDCVDGPSQLSGAACVIVMRQSPTAVSLPSEVG